MDEGEVIGETLLIPWPDKAEKITSLDVNAEVAFEKTPEGLLITVPYGMRGSSPLAPAFRML